MTAIGRRSYNADLAFDYFFVTSFSSSFNIVVSLTYTAYFSAAFFKIYSEIFLQIMSNFTAAGKGTNSGPLAVA